MAEKFKIDLDPMIRKVKIIPKYVDKSMAATMMYHRGPMERYAKLNAPWKDRTTNARNGLIAATFKEKKLVHGLVLAHQVPYGIWLEVRKGGKLAIILPTIQDRGPRVMKTLEKILNKYEGRS